MKLSEINRTLRHMEHLREDADEAGTPAERRRMDKEYGRLWKLIEAYVMGSEPVDDEQKLDSGK